MNFFKTLLNPAREDPQFKDRALVVRAANLLQVGEFQLLQLAYEAWYDHDLPEALVSNLFSSYMMRNEVPVWARDYARKVVEDAAVGKIDDQNPSVHRYDHEYIHASKYGIRPFIFAVGVLVLMMGGGILLADNTPGKSASRFPPYLEVSDLPQNGKHVSWENKEIKVEDVVLDHMNRR